MKLNRNSALLVLFITIFVDLLGFGIVIPILPNYVKEIGASNWMVGVVTAVYSLMQFLFTPIWGSLSDRIGRRPVIIISIVITIFSSLMFSQATGLFVLIISRVLGGIGSGNISAAQAYISDITPPEKRAQSMGLIGAAFGLGFIFGPPVGGIIKSTYGIEYVGYLTAFIGVINLVMAFFFLPESIHQKNKHSSISIFPVKDFIRVFKMKGLAALFFIYHIYIVAFFMFQTTAALIWKEIYHFTDKEIGYVFAFIGISTTLMQGFLIGFFTRLFGEKKLLYIGTLLMMLCLIFFSYIPLYLFIPVGLLILLFLAIANGMIGPSGLSILSQMSSPNEQGKVLGLYQSFGSLARVIGPLVGTLFYDVNPHLPYWIGAIILCINVILIRTVISVLKIQKEEIN
jgi:DHA1 family tetracycline resistance protein-like MFS transporter